MSKWIIIRDFIMLKSYMPKIKGILYIGENGYRLNIINKLLYKKHLSIENIIALCLYKFLKPIL